MPTICSLQRLGATTAATAATTATTATTAPDIVVSVDWTPPPTSPCFSFDPGLPPVTPFTPLPPAAPVAFVQHELDDGIVELMAPPAKTYHHLLRRLVHIVNAAGQGRETEVIFYEDCGIEMTEVDAVNGVFEC